MISFLCFVVSSVFSLLYIELSHLINENSQASVAALDFVACQSVAEGGEYP